MSEEGNGQSDIAVMEANDFKQMRRLKRILESHDSVFDAADKLFQLEIEGAITNDARKIGIQYVVKKFIRESWELLDHRDRELDIWTKKIGTIELEQQSNIEIVGLDDFLDTQEFYHVEWFENREARHGPNQQIRRSRTYTLPEQISWQAYQLLWSYLSREKGLEMSVEEMEHQKEAEFDYKDLLQASDTENTSETGVAGD